MATLRSRPVDGFRLAYDDLGSGTPVVLLHGWPGDRTDYRTLVPLLVGQVRVVVPDLRGFGESDKHLDPPQDAYRASAQARSVLGLLDDLEVESAILVGYDVGSMVAQTVAKVAPERVDALVLAPPLPGAAERLLEPEHLHEEFWYQRFHQLPVVEEIIDGRPDAVRAYLHHIWSHWIGPGHGELIDLDHLVEVYGGPGAFTASVGWYRAGAGSIGRARSDRPPGERSAVPLRVVWPHHDPLFPLAWSDRLGEYFADVVMTQAPTSGHFVPLEVPELMAAEVLGLVDQLMD